MYAVIRLRSSIGLKKEIRDTFKMLRLNTVNNCVIVPETPSLKGMVKKMRDYVTYGEIDKEMLVDMLKKRLRLRGKKRIEEKKLKKVTGYDSFEKLAEALIADKVKLKDLKEVETTFRLTPASKGLKSIKKHYPKGDLGYRGKEINKLLQRMI